MNERIRELAEQATRSKYWNATTQVMIEDFDKEKFAELIVKECSVVIQKEVSLYYKDGGHPSEEFMAGHYAGSTWARVMIKQHFGVEE